MIMDTSRTSNMPLWQQSSNVFADPMSTFIPPMQHDVQGEDWEDWLRWEPNAEATSPEDGTMNSMSSTHNSPLQDHTLPISTDISGKDAAFDSFQIPIPIIVGEDAPLNGTISGHDMNEDMFLFGQSSATGTDFSFDSVDMFAPLPSAPILSDSATESMVWLPSNEMLAPDASLLMPVPAIRTLLQPSPIQTTSASTPDWQNTSPKSGSQGDTSPSSSSSSPTQGAQPPAKKRPGRKRKVDIEREKEEENDQDSDPAGDGSEPPVKKTSHNVIEKRYRNNLNDKIVELRNSVPALRALGRAKVGKDSEDLEGLTPAHKLNKATVMGKATEYIRHLEKRNKVMTDEMAALKARLAAAESAITRNVESQVVQRGSIAFRQPSICSQTTGTSMLGIPADQMMYGQTVTHQHMPQSQAICTTSSTSSSQSPNEGRSKKKRASGTMNKVMMGTMAGLMVMEGFSEQSDDKRALSAVPTGLFKRYLMPGSHDIVHTPTSQATMALFKLVFALGVVAYLLLPLISSRPEQKKKPRNTIRLPHAPSLASPVEVRRNAWLTAVQTVYERKHFLLEVVSVTSKMALLSVRRLIGSEAYCVLTGANKEDEAARVKAWDIAINAQLAGGDAEVSYYRLLLTLMVSGTLPDSPTRLMQKAVHFRVFFWEVANAGYGNIFGFRRFTEKVGQFYWDSARKLQRELVHARAQSRLQTGDEDIELLPEHLASLLELECEEVLNAEMIQRAWNLAWNKPSSHETTASAARDGVVEDHAIHSPLDAVAAWYANMAVDVALLDTLGDRPSTWDADYCIGQAVSVAPPTSATQGRALAAKAVMSNMNREMNIIAALDAIHLDAHAGGSVNFVNHAPATPDIFTALTLAKLLVLINPNATGAARLRGQEMLSQMRIAPSSFTLLSAVALYRLLRLVNGDRRLSPVATYNIEDMAASLRVWIGSSSGKSSGLTDNEVACAKLVDICLDITRKIGGWDERDSGYGSADVSPSRSRATTAMIC